MDKYLDPNFLYAHLTHIIYIDERGKQQSCKKEFAIENKMYFKNGKPDIYKYIENSFFFKFEFDEISVVKAYLNKYYKGFWYSKSDLGMYDFKTNKFTSSTPDCKDFFIENLIELLSKINLVIYEYSKNRKN